MCTGRTWALRTLGAAHVRKRPTPATGHWSGPISTGPIGPRLCRAGRSRPANSSPPISTLECCTGATGRVCRCCPATSTVVNCARWWCRRSVTRPRSRSPTTASASQSIWIGACCIGRRRARQKPGRAGSFVPPSIFGRAPARSTATTSSCCGRICRSPSICTYSVGRRWCGPIGAPNRRATRSTARWCSRASAHPRSSLADTMRRSASPPSPSPSSTSAISAAASATSTSTPASTRNWSTSAWGSPASRLPNCESTKAGGRSSFRVPPANRRVAAGGLPREFQYGPWPGVRQEKMSGLINVWHGLTPGQGTLLGGAFVVLAGIIAFSTGAIDRRSQHKRFHYQEMKTLYAEALRIGRDLEILKLLPPDIRRGVLTEKAEAIDRVISELALTGNYQTADLAIAYAYQQSVQLGEWVRQVEADQGSTDRIEMWLDNLPTEQRAALRDYENVTVNRRDVVQAVRNELRLYVPVWSRYRRALRDSIKAQQFPLN